MKSREPKVFVNLSNKRFEEKTYNNTSPTAYSYKPDTGFWGATRNDSKYFSEWDKEYGLDLIRQDNSENIYVTSFVFDKNKVYLLRPSEDSLILEGFNNVVESKGDSLTPEQKRKLLVEYIKDKKGLQDTKHVICQIDTDADMMELERIFGGFERSENPSQEVFKNLALNMRKAFIENFSGVEVTEDAINEESEYTSDIISCAEWTKEVFPDYIVQPGFWDVPSVAVFDTSAISIIDLRILSPKEIEKIEEQRDGMEI